MAGLPFGKKVQILKRGGYSEQEISAMDPGQLGAEVQEAIHYGIYTGSLPPAPIESRDAFTLVDPETGERVVWSEIAKRGGTIAHVSIRQNPPCSFKQALSLFQRDVTMDPVDREHLKRLAADSRAEEHWELIKNRRPLVSWSASPGWFIWHMLAARRAAELVGNYPERQRQAENAQGLATFLRGSGAADEETYQLLESLAHELRAPEELRPFNSSPIPLSRKGRNTSGGQRTQKTRELKAFMSWMREYLKATYGQPFNEVVATLTDIAFSGQETTLDQVRAAVKPTTRRGRSAKP